MNKLLLILLFCYYLNAVDKKINVENGTVYFLKTEKIVDGRVEIGKKSIAFIPYNDSEMLAIIPFDYKSSLGEVCAKVFSGAKELETLVFNVKKGKYKEENLTVSSKHVTLPSKELRKRTSKEYADAYKIYNKVTKKNYLKKKFALPMSTKTTSEYGNARVFNGKIARYHSGVDFRAKVGSIVKVVNDGKVVLVDNRYYAGGSVIVDHGYGVYSCYFHLSGFDVSVGDVVRRGEIIARSGKSGRVTGPHLHLSFKVHGVSVSPLHFMDKFNNLVLN
ncbi:MAG: Cell wall endopeptidase, family M23/M37 [uncultured Campylobacterales bacterium]|uniref:Cell wall endopeptidase, family M23/M37 n=1 Tax=uncultured Campylobacterales bacterium TaxID=352960 RepID=A0A6S6S3G6_9BACT|nr:MAG: Cell wall endopeptidase, family M23/M37 [uncultured Campylobacterales bacterium]